MKKLSTEIILFTNILTYMFSRNFYYNRENYSTFNFSGILYRDKFVLNNKMFINNMVHMCSTTSILRIRNIIVCEKKCLQLFIKSTRFQIDIRAFTRKVMLTACFDSRSLTHIILHLEGLPSSWGHGILPL